LDTEDARGSRAGPGKPDAQACDRCCRDREPNHNPPTPQHSSLDLLPIMSRKVSIYKEPRPMSTLVNHRRPTQDVSDIVYAHIVCTLTSPVSSHR
jgi:hypothetical protein